MFTVTDLMVKVVPGHDVAILDGDVWMSDCPKYSDSCGCSRTCSGCTHSRAVVTSVEAGIQSGVVAQERQRATLAQLKEALRARLAESETDRALV